MDIKSSVSDMLNLKHYQFSLLLEYSHRSICGYISQLLKEEIFFFIHCSPATTLPMWPDTPGLGPSGSPTPHGLGPGSRTRGPAEGLQGFGDLGPPGSPMPPSLGPGSQTRGPAEGFGEQAHHLWMKLWPRHFPWIPVPGPHC